MLKYVYLTFILLVFLTTAVVAQQQAPAILWQKCLGGTKEDRARSILPAYDQGYIVAGSTKSNDGDLTAHYGSTDSTDAWLVKLDAQGNIEWQKNYGGTGDDEFTQVIHTADQAYLAIGLTNTIDNGDVSGFHAVAGNYQFSDIWVVKVSRQGVLLWQRCLGGTGMEKIGSVRQTADSGFVIIGTAGTKNGDISATGSGSIWVVKLNKQGNIVWNKRYGGTNPDRGADIRTLPGGGYVLVGETSSEDGDFPGSHGNLPVGFQLRIDEAGTIQGLNYLKQRGGVTNVLHDRNGSLVTVFGYLNCYPMNTDISAISIGGNGGVIGYEACDMFETLSYNLRGADNLYQQADGNYLLAAGTTDSRNMVLQGGEDAFLSNFKLNNAYPNTDNYIWKKAYGGSLNDAFASIAPVEDHGYICAGFTNSSDGNVSGNHGGFDCWIVKFGVANFVKGLVYYDNNGNGVKDGNESFANNILVQAKKDTTTYSNITYQGLYGFALDTGTYTLSIPDLPRFTTISPASQTVSFTTSGQRDSLPAFALRITPGQRDYDVNVAGFTAVRPGFEVNYWLTYSNKGTDTLVNKPLKLIKDSRLQFVSAVPAQTGVVADTITWNIPELLPGATKQVLITMRAATPPALNYTDTVRLTAIIDTTGDIDVNNNIQLIRQLVTGAYDPNDKQEGHGTMLYKNEYDAGKALTYTIRFQNTGNDTAFTVVVRDTLSKRLTGSSLEMIAASHPYKLVIKDNRYCTWTFDNILLVDSNRNEPKSHGYIIYRIKPVAGLAVQDNILNRAAIYFDYNLPVITNTQETVLRATPIPPPVAPLVSGLQAAYCNNQGVQKGKITNLPPTGGTTTAMVKLDNAVLPIAADSTFAFKVDTLAAGQHQITVTFTNVTGAKTLLVTFGITAAATPDVNITANIVNVTNLSNAVTVTATNAAGGGTAPLYTFARDKAFTVIIQPEGIAATATIDPATLTIGDNKVYVRMKTNLNCYTAPTNMDSILIRRDAATGIQDPGNPGAPILISPNPFGQQLRVSGLNAGKTYQIVLYDARGRALFRSDVKNKQVFEIPAAGMASGIYWLSIYDAKKKLIGTEKVLK